MKASGSVRVADGSFGLLEGFDIPVGTVDFSNGLIAIMSSGALICTGMNRGVVAVDVELRDNPPSRVESSGWDDIVEDTVNSPHGSLYVQSLALESDADVIGDFPCLSFRGKGTYRVRAHVAGRDPGLDAVTNQTEERYLLMVWPGLPAPQLIVRATDQRGYGMRLSALRQPSRMSPGAALVEQEPAGKRAEELRAVLRSVERKRQAADDGGD